jgi:hypothetical protein
LVVRAFVALGLVDAGSDFVATARLAAGVLAAGVPVAGEGSAGFSAAAAAGVASSAAGVSVDATPIVLESVRWQVSHVTTVRTKLPS